MRAIVNQIFFFSDFKDVSCSARAVYCMRLLQECFIYYSDQGTEMPPPAKITFYRTRDKNTQPACFFFHRTLAAVFFLSSFFSAV